MPELTAEEKALIEAGACESEIQDAVDENAEEVDELVELVRSQRNLSETRHAEILARVNECSNSLERLSTQTQAENPAMTQVLSQLAEMRVEMDLLRQELRSTATMSKVPTPNGSEPNPGGLIETEVLIEEPSGESVENPPQQTVKKNRFI
jgi:hypothetical protein